ncbi:MAG: hypothetical protein BIFFINMI_03353 [Phycisphaerae bacterium]|nr:hypothetical protein [Phycisphaerae bacterium]
MGAAVKRFQDLIAWQKAMDLVEEVYRLSERFPRAEQFGLTSQVRRAAVSVPSNIAEGQSRTSTPDFLRHLSIARASLAEVETQLMIAERLNFVTKEQSAAALSVLRDIAMLVNGLMRALRSRSPQRSS